MVQVEKRNDITEAFGKERIEGKTQITMKFKNFLNKICGSATKELYYFSTQEDDGDDSIDDNDVIHPTSCRQLLDQKNVHNALD